MRVTIVSVSLLGVACHSLEAREHRRTTERDDAQAGAATAGGSASSAGAPAVDAEAGAGGSEPAVSGSSGAGGSNENDAAEDYAGEGGEGGERERGSPSSCDAWFDCVPDDPCWALGVRCEEGGQPCVPTQPAIARSPCANGGECTGDGSCVATMPSCALAETPGCGVVTIQGGKFKMGWRAVEPEAGAAQPISVSSFAIDAYEVSVARFRRFWDAGHPLRTPVRYPNGQTLSGAAATEPALTDEVTAYNWSWLPASREAHPINRIDWDTALAFCAWDGGRLPTEAEWEYVATGRRVEGLVPGRTYPWGEDDPSCELANSILCEWQRSVEVDALPGYGGVFQMAGNVLEWTADVYEPYGGACWHGASSRDPACFYPSTGQAMPRTLKGGSFGAYGGQLQGSWRIGEIGVTGARGVRCAHDFVAP
jgi:formylglycine-generating enzyme required for sulfatase activity